MISAIVLTIIAIYIHFTIRFSRNRNKAMQQTGEKWYRYACNEIFTERGHEFLKDHFCENFEPARVRVESERKFVHITVLGVYLRLLEEKGEDPTKFDTLQVDNDAISHARIMGRQAFRSLLYKDNI